MFAGRSVELKQLNAGFDHALRGHPARFLISGRPGVRKTALLEEARTHAAERGLHIASVAMVDGAVFPALWPWRRLIAGAVRQLPQERLGPLFAGLSQGESAALARAFPDIAALGAPAATTGLNGVAASAGAAPDDDGDRGGRTHAARESVEPDEHAGQPELLSAVTNLAIAFLGLGPFAVFIDNVQLMDPSSLSLLRAVIGNLVNAPICSVVTIRDGSGTRSPDVRNTEAVFMAASHASRISLGPLSNPDIYDLSTVYGLSLSTEDVNEVRTATGGSPLMLSELFRALARSRPAEPEPRGSGPEFRDMLQRIGPDALADAVARRVEPLRADSATLLHRAAVLGPEFSVTELNALVEPGAPAAHGAPVEATASQPGDAIARRDAVAELEQTELIRSVRPGVYAFPHDLIRRALLARLSEHRRRQLHGEVARALEDSLANAAGEYAERLMDLYRGAQGPEARRKALHYGVVVADRALAGLAWESAAAVAGDLLDEAAEVWSGSRPDGGTGVNGRAADAGLIAELRRIRGVALFRLGRRSDGMREIEEAAAWYRHHGDRDGIARLLREPLFFQVGELEMRDLFYEAREILGPEHPQSFWARVGSIYARYQVDGDYQTALEETNAMVREFAGSGQGPQEAETLLLSMRAYIRIKLRQLDKAKADLARVSGAGVANRPRLEIRTTVPRIALYLRYGRTEAAERAARKVAEAVERSGDYSYIGRFYAFLLRILLRRGAWEEIEQTARRVREVDPAEPLGYSIPILARYHRGAVEAGDLLRDQLRRLAAEADLLRGHTVVESALVDAFRTYVLESFDVEALEDTDHTRRSLRTLLSLDESHPVVRIRAAFALSELLYVDWLQGRVPPARDLNSAETALELNNSIWLLHDQYAHFARGLLHLVADAPRRAERTLRSAAAVAYRQDDYVTAAWIAATRARHAHRVTSADMPYLGGHLEQEAAGIGSRLGMKPLLDHLSGASLLSPRERNVLQAVADGKSNKEIAAELNISNYTVINHMRHIMRKLGTSSRTEALAVARRRGVLPQ